ncbi:MAG: 3-oxoacyl-[acyl-carrier-protein] reductase [Deltaproteobacteria bacterium RIFCSPHIGHO2_12_FULL_43_9]|nr:MAG: 3-oxoacyl-[acyl-carrier-protein] reductase [Deltaproteobacteria bacterium RIFCSPHIGHO2_12_FULL_43_9]
MGFSDKIAIVTGGSRGIGRAITLSLAKEGATVVLSYKSNIQAAEETVNLSKEFSGRVLAKQWDIGRFQETQDVIADVEKELGKVDILINNAGITSDNLFMRMKEEEWDKVIETNLKGAFNCCRAVIRGMVKRRFGRIINISSIVAESGNPGQANYCASKAGVIGLTRSLALELASRQITVNAVTPGFVATDMTDALTEEQKKLLISKIPMGRVADPNEIASLVTYLASEGASYISGQTIGVNGALFT